MQSIAITTRKLTAGLALGLAVTVVASSPALAAKPAHHAAKSATKVERVISKGGKQRSAKSVKRQLKRAGMKAGHSPKTKRVNRGLCYITYYNWGAVAVCPDDVFGWWNDVFVDYYGDYYGWLYWGYVIT